MALFCTLVLGKLVCLFVPEAVSNMPYSYTEAIVQHGGLVVLKPFVPSGSGTTLGHAGVIINGDGCVLRLHWQRVCNGKTVPDTVYPNGYFKRENPDYDPENPPTVNILSLWLLRLLA